VFVPVAVILLLIKVLLVPGDWKRIPSLKIVPPVCMVFLEKMLLEVSTNIPTLVFAPFVCMVFPEALFSRADDSRNMPTLAMPVPSVFMVLFVMVLLCPAVSRRRPELSLVPFVVMVFSEMVFPGVRICIPKLLAPVPCVFMVLFVMMLFVWMLVGAEPSRRTPWLFVDPFVDMVFPETVFSTDKRRRMP